MKVPFLNLSKQYKNLKREIDDAVFSTIESGHFVMGDAVSKFEKNIGDYLGLNAVSCASGSDALFIALKAADIGPEDEVITTPFTFFATAGAIVRTGAKPVFVDIKKDTYNINPKLIEPEITKNTKAIIPVHIFGYPADMDEIMSIAKEHELVVIEDACQSIGAKYKNIMTGGIGDYGTFSFFPTKNLGAYGDGGLISVKESDNVKYVKMFRLHGSEEKYHHDFVGINSRLDALQAAILDIKLKYLDQWNEKRQGIAKTYNESLKDLIITPVEEDEKTHVYHQYSIRTKNRDRLREHLNENGIASGVYYPVPLHLQRCFLDLGYKKGDLPISELVADEILSLPIYPEIEEEQIAYTAEAVRSFF
ncbi:DegT/DnrJ/EryC1/StrS family aminotransferase [Patescibacteria group bacterium]